MISISVPIIYENIATPNSRRKEQTNLSKLLLGLKSPKPIVESDVKL
jgi:hypothetical protein